MLCLHTVVTLCCKINYAQFGIIFNDDHEAIVTAYVEVQEN